MGVFALIGLVVVVSAVMLVLAISFVPSISASVEQARVERESQEASWRIHQQATRAFGQMLDAARKAEKEDSP